MIYKTSKGKSVNIPNKELDKLIDNLDISMEDAINLWLEDNNYQTNEEQVALDKVASKVKTMGNNSALEKKERAPRTVKTSDEKINLFNQILANLNSFYANNVTVLNENKLISVKIGDRTFKIDIIEQRKPKK